MRSSFGRGLIVRIGLEDDAIAAEPLRNAKRSAAKWCVLPCRADDFRILKRVLGQNTVDVVGLCEERADGGIPRPSQPDDHRMRVGRLQRRDAAVRLDRRRAIAWIEDCAVGKGNVGRRHGDPVGKARVRAEVIGDASSVRRHVAVAPRRNARGENRNVAIIRRKTDQRLTEERIERKNLLVDSDQGNQRRRVAGVSNPQNVRRTGPRRPAPRARDGSRGQ